MQFDTDHSRDICVGLVDGNSGTKAGDGLNVITRQAHGGSIEPHRQEEKPMGSKTVVMNSKLAETEELSPRKPTATLGIQSDTAFSEAVKRLRGRDLCSIADLTVQEMAAIMELAHEVKANPEDFHPLSPKAFLS